MHLLLPPEYVGDRAHYMLDGADGGFAVVSVQDVAPALEENKAMRLHNDGYTADRTARRVAHVPQGVRDLWLSTEGWDAYRPDLFPHELAKKFNDPDWAHLRTAEGRLAVQGDVIR